MTKKWEIGMEIESVEDFKEFAKGVSRECFEKDYLKRDEDSDEEEERVSFYINEECYFNCPHRLDLKASKFCPSHMRCKQCWIDSVKNIYFKDDIDKSKLVKKSNNENIVKNEIEENTYNNIKVKKDKDYNREYSLSEVFKFEEGTLFDCSANSYIVKINRSMLYASNDDNDDWDVCYITKDWLNSKYKLHREETEVEFQQILETGDKCKVLVKHYLIDEMEAKGLKEFMDFNKYMINLCGSKELDSNDIKEIIKDGKWFMRRDN